VVSALGPELGAGSGGTTSAATSTAPPASGGAAAKASNPGLDGRLLTRAVRYKRINATVLGLVSGAALAAILVGVWLAIGVIVSLSRGTRLRLPGFT
jgi:hypothetical protein